MSEDRFTLPEPKSVLVFEAHSDDAVIGMGATIKKFTSKGIKITLCTVTKGETQHSADTKESIVGIRKDEGTCADKVLGIEEHIFLDHGCQAVVNDRPTFHEFVKIIREVRPSWIFSQGYHESHRDHRNIAAIAEEAWWKATEKDVLIELGEPHKADAFLFYEVLPMFTEKPDVCIDVSDCWESKLEAMKCFQSQMNTMNEVFNLINGKGLYRGYLIDAKYAEAFIYSRFMPRNSF
ncbi:MAG: PIG-L deacetylase family protein [Candidatus Hodarchaeota archaeon]